MQWRLLVRRCPVKSFTIVGDIAQTSSAAGAMSWDRALTPLLGDRWNIEELTVNYRTPTQIAEAAVRMANAAGQVVSAPKAVRDGEWEPIVDFVDASEVINQVVAVVPAETAAVGGGLLAVITPASMVRATAAALRSVYGNRIGHGAGSLEQNIVVIDPHEAKGLEFDGVIIVEPAALLAGASGRVGDLYVSMTRPTRRLRLITSEPLPAGIQK